MIVRGRALAFPTVVALLLLSLPASGVDAQEGVRPGESGWEISAHVGAYDDQPEFDPGNGAVSFDPEHRPLLGARLGYTFPSGLFVQAEGGYIRPVLAERRRSPRRRDTDVLLYGGALGYNVPLHDRLQLFGAVGAGAYTWSPPTGDSDTDFSVSYGGGTRIFLTRSLAFRGDVRVHQVPDALSASRQRAGTSAEETFWGWELSGGVSYFLGGPRDSDDDGVRDERDACPGTPREATVDESGCPVDGDGDGVPDHRDQCPGTPSGARVDDSGCGLDGDGDGVLDGIDQCPDTPRGATVDARGCSSDSDDDGVLDGIDQCPDTSPGAEVDERGCALDEDGDGVPDGIDECPNTAPGSEVDEQGCPDEVQRQLEEEGRLVLEAVHFEFDSAELRESAVPILTELGEVLVARPGVRVEIQGHTDSVGAEAYNQDLSQRRAESVLDFLLENFSELQRDQFVAEGYGESQPVASNDTEEGRQQNRRVEFVVLQAP